MLPATLFFIKPHVLNIIQLAATQYALSFMPTQNICVWNYLPECRSSQLSFSLVQSDVRPHSRWVMQHHLVHCIKTAALPLAERGCCDAAPA